VTELETERLLLRRPRAEDVPAIFARYASDPEVTRYMAWPTHTSIEQTRAFVAFSDDLWLHWPLGPYLVFARDGLSLLGGAGVVMESAERAETGYVLARDAWGNGYATEALQGTIASARRVGIRRLTAGVHADHAASVHVLEKAGFVREGVRPGQPTDFPNLPAPATRDVLRYVLDL
jgi:ribosomal-protein-alanine N-acetyltransferase